MALDLALPIFDIFNPVAQFGPPSPDQARLAAHFARDMAKVGVGWATGVYWWSFWGPIAGAWATKMKLRRQAKERFDKDH